ncbi:MAG TPA: hypothetical protein VIJ25_04315 [Methylococcales bacterium]
MSVADDKVECSLLSVVAKMWNILVKKMHPFDKSHDRLQVAVKVAGMDLSNVAAM